MKARGVRHPADIKSNHYDYAASEAAIENGDKGSIMTDLNHVVEIVKKINDYCNEMDQLRAKIDKENAEEKQFVENQADSLISEMQQKVKEFKNINFIRLRRQVEGLVTILREEYEKQWNELPDIDSTEYSRLTYNENIKKVRELIDDINDEVAKLNAFDFDKAVPPVHIEMKDETFITRAGDEIGETNGYQTKKRSKVIDPKPLKKEIIKLLLICKKAIVCIEVMADRFETEFNRSAYNSAVRSSAKAWLTEAFARSKVEYDKRFDELFRDEKASAVPKEFFTNLERQGIAAEVDINSGTAEYNESINIGDIKLLVESSDQHIGYINDSPVLSKYLKDGYLSAPLILDLKSCGNILINVSDESFDESAVALVNQLIIQFLVSFPANRINFCLIDIDNKMGFSQFKILNKINNGILLNGIIRDDRQLENTIKDMEQTMYKIDEDQLCYNNVKNIYEYNKKFEANPQSMHLFVLINYPACMRDDLAKRVLKLVQNGNKEGIYCLIVNNKSVPLAPGYKKSEYDQFIEGVGKNAVIINKSENGFEVEVGTPNKFVPKDNISVKALPGIVEMLKTNAESNRQKVIPLSLMFEDTDKKVANKKKSIPSSAEVLEIPIGARGGEVQDLLLKTTGDGSAHAVVIGGTGSGKSNLLHAIIMSACYKYSPDELNLYLVDFKGGVEFKYYEANKDRKKQLPHIKLTGLTSDLNDGVAILDNLQKELRRREDEFRTNRVEDIVQYRNLGKKMPRLFVIIDEIQELFEQDENLGRKAINIMRELFKKGRAFGINILWASQNIPKVPGLRDQVLSQIGNRISLRLNEPQDAEEIKIDPKVVKNLNRPEKGLGVINDIRYGNESIEFRVAFAETSENRQKYSAKIIDKWKSVAENSEIARQPLFIVGDDDELSPVDNTIYGITPTKAQIKSKAFEKYVIQLGQNFVTGKPYDIALSLREDKSNMLLSGFDVEILRDMMGYSLLSTIIAEKTDADCIAQKAKIYYANGEMINPKNSGDLFNVMRTDFENIIENVSPVKRFEECIKDVYKLYKKRSEEADNTEYAKAEAPCFVFVHSLQRYADLFKDNPQLDISEQEELDDGLKKKDDASPINSGRGDRDELEDLFINVESRNGYSASSSFSAGRQRKQSLIYFTDAIKELLTRSGKFGIHFIISVDNPLIQGVKDAFADMEYKIFVKGSDPNTIIQLVGDYRESGSLANPKVALVVNRNERTKIRVYRYNAGNDGEWYRKLCVDYGKLEG